MRSKRSGNCKCTLDHASGKVGLVVDCRECHGGSSLANRECLDGVLEGLRGRYGVERVILSDYLETEYSGASFDVLAHYLRLLSLTSSLAKRTARMDKGCAKCRVNPGRVWSDLGDALSTDFEAFHGGIDEAYEAMSNARGGKGCEGCISSLKGDVEFVLKETRALASAIMLNAYRMVV